VARKAVKFGVLGGVLTLVLGYSGIGYFAGAVPFPLEPRGDITAGSLCDAMGSVGDRERAAEELRNALPTSREYSSSGDQTIRDEDRWVRDICRVYGDGDQLFSTNAELVGWHWAARSDLIYDGGDGKQERFQAGNAAFMTQRGALIVVPCTPPHSPSERDRVRVVVYLHQLLVGDEEENTHTLLAVALSAARAAHERAECTRPSKLPRNVPEWGYRG
jgi:hypothetical protein